MSTKLELAAMNCHHRFYELEDFFKSASELGYKYAEIWTGPQHFFMDYNGYENVEKLTNLEKKYDVKIIGICPEQTNPKPNNMAAKDEETQKRALAYFKNAIDVACKVKVNQVVVTSGWAFLSESMDEAYKRSVSMLKKVATYAKEKGMNLAIEALQPEESLIANTAKDLKRLIDDVDCNSLKVCIDIGAMARANDTIDGYYEIFKDNIVHAHFVDVDMKKMNTHLSWGDGTRDMKKDISDFEKNGYTGILSVECVNSKDFPSPNKADKRTMDKYKSL